MHGEMARYLRGGVNSAEWRFSWETRQFIPEIVVSALGVTAEMSPTEIGEGIESWIVSVTEQELETLIDDTVGKWFGSVRENLDARNALGQYASTHEGEFDENFKVE